MADTTDGAASKTDTSNNGRPAVSRTRSQRSPSPAPSQVPKRIKTAPIVSASSSVGGSPKTSREPSPNRVGFKLQQQPSSNTTTTTTTSSRLSRSRKNSQELNRINVSSTIPDTPSPAAIQRALAAAGPARQHSSPLTSEFPNDAQNNKSQKSSRNPSVTRSLRLTSPPPSLNHKNIKRDLEPPPTPSIIVNQATPKSASSFENIEEEAADEMLSPGMRSPARAVVTTPRLEAVQESDDPETPALSSGNKQFITKVPTRSATIAETLEDKGSIISHESGSESAGGKSVKSNTAVETKSTPKPSLQPRRSYSQMNSTKGKITGDGTLRNMTVETETVSSVPLTTVGASTDSRITSGKQDPNATLRMKPSTETIRPRKEKKKTVRKAPSIASTTGTSKADIFEAKVKSAVEEADSSDSEETFVYESNPPDPVPRRHHSRTPSMNSVASQGDYYRGRYRQDANTSLVGKKSMKFANSSKNNDGDDISSAQHTPTSARPSVVNGSLQFPRHIGRHGRNPGHLSLFDNEAPFSNVPRSPRKATAGSFNRKASPRPHTPRSAHYLRGPPTGKSFGGNYDLEADDERTPLISSVRSGRSRRRGYNDDLDFYYHPAPRRSTLKWFGACACLGSLFSMLVALVVIGLILCSRALQNVHLKSIENVLASDKQIIFDLRVQAINPNLVGIQITDMNLFVHARSSYVGDSKWWREHGSNGTAEDFELRKRDNVDEGTDPVLDDPHLMLLGQVSAFDAPLSFDASPWHHDIINSVGEVRLDRPGNSTQIDKDRWETVLHHDFDLIVRGVLTYTLPISSHVRSAEISGKTLVKPNVLPEPTPEPTPDKPKSGNGTNSEVIRISVRRKISQNKPVRLSVRFTA